MMTVNEDEAQAEARRIAANLLINIDYDRVIDALDVDVTRQFEGAVYEAVRAIGERLEVQS